MGSMFEKAAPQGSTFKNNDIYMVNDEEASNYEEPRERHLNVQYKLKVCDNPASKNMPLEEEYDNNNYESIDRNSSLNDPSIPINVKIL